MRKNFKQRSVGIQNTESFNAEARVQIPRLVKKAGFRNLLQNTVTIASKSHGERNEGLSLPEERNSKSVQAALDEELSFQSRPTANQNVDARMHIRGDKAPGKALETVKPVHQGPNPGTSKMTSNTISTISVASQTNVTHSNRPEGSLAVVYNYGEKSVKHSVSSSMGVFYGSQGSRRFSDETVLLIEDYQSYDQRNAARRQEVARSRRRNIFSCCGPKPRESPEVLTRPIPLPFGEDSLEKDEIVCRICHEGEDLEPLIQPCLCKGSVGCVHAKCLKNWLEQSSTSRCELCNYPYAIQMTKKYAKCYSIKVFYKTVIDKRSMAYDVISFVIITPLTLVGVVMCIQASAFSEEVGGSGYQMGYITKAGMIMLSGTIAVAYAVWLYTLLSYHYKSWKKWYDNCFDVEVLPVRMTSEERIEASKRLGEEINRRQLSREHNSTLVTVLQTSGNYNFYQRRVSVPPVPSNHER